VVVGVVLLVALVGITQAERRARRPHEPRTGPRPLPLNSSGNYIYYCTGNCQKDAIVKTTPGAMLMGGGLDVDNAFVWMINRSIGGDFLVIRTDDDDGYDEYIYSLGPLNSCATLVILNRNGSFESFVNETVYQADAIFFAGGDQWTYYFNWKQTPMSSAIQNSISMRGVPIGGTSAGEEVLGEFLYPAEFNSSVTSATALKNPYTEQLQIATAFFTVPYLQDTIWDAHFVQRNRMGRLLVMVARLWNDVWAPNGGLGVGLDESTAVLLDTKTGIASLTSWNRTGCGTS